VAVVAVPGIKAVSKRVRVYACECLSTVVAICYQVEQNILFLLSFDQFASTFNKPDKKETLSDML
jgi:hypothetical protein